MAQKLGNGGHSQENYDPSTGKYTSGPSSLSTVGEKNADSMIKQMLDIKEGKELVDCRKNLPTITNKGKPREYFSEMEKERKEKYARDFNERFKDKVEAIQRKVEEGLTSEIDTPERDELRKQIIADEITSQNGKRQIQNGHKAIIVLGLPGSGKSTLSNFYLDKLGAYEIDADNIKERIPEFQADENAVSQVHDESVNLSKEMMAQVGQNGSNLVIGKVGARSKSIKKMVMDLAAQGYEISIAYNDLPGDEAINRNISRYVTGKSKRLVPIDVILGADGNIPKVYNELLNMDEVKGGVVYSNDVNFGDSPRFIEKDKEGDDLVLWS